MNDSSSDFADHSKMQNRGQWLPSHIDAPINTESIIAINSGPVDYTAADRATRSVNPIWYHSATET